MLESRLRQVKCGCIFYYNGESRSKMSKKQPMGREVVRDRGENIPMAYGTLALEAHYTLAFHTA